MLVYFKNNWHNNKFINYSEISDEEFIKRTNNYLESFNGHLNSI